MLQGASAKLRADRDIVMTAVQHHASSLQYASVALRADREVVLAAVRKGGYALQYASAAVRADREVVYTAMRQHDIKYRENGELIYDPNRTDAWWTATDHRGWPRIHGRNHWDIRGGYFKYASPTLHADLDFVFAAVMLCNAYAALRHVSVELQMHPALDYLRERRLQDPLDQDPLDQDPLDQYPLRSVRHQEQTYWKRIMLGLPRV